MDAFVQGQELRNSPRVDGRLYAQMLYGRPLRSTDPAHCHAFEDVWQGVPEERDER